MRTKKKKIIVKSSNVASGDACGGEWDNGDHPLEQWANKESW